jgi:acyl-CoA synthetase (AMP-forming)/AMP-acid ligase II
LERTTGELAEPLTGRRWDRETVLRQVLSRVAHLQKRGMKPGDLVFIHHGNRLEVFADLLAIWNAGGCAVPIDARLTPFEVETLAGAARPRFSFHIGEIDSTLSGALASAGVDLVDSVEAGRTPPGKAPPQSSFDLDQDALILFTSGSTGDPKGVVHTHRSLRARWVTLQQSLGTEKYRRTLCLLPTHFGHGLICNCLYPWLSGCDLFILPAFKADVAMRLGRILDEHDITFMSSVPSVWRLALKAARPPERGSLERVFCGSAPLTAHLWGQIREWTGTRDVCNSYGITETGSWVAGTSVGDFEPEDGLIGVPWGAVIKVMKDGSAECPPGFGEECAPDTPGYVWLNTPALMKGYMGRDDLTRQVVSQGWFMTGDIGAKDERGWLYLRGRERDEINKGGTKVYPSDIDAVAERFSGVNDVCCFAVEDPLYGQNVGLAVALEGGEDAQIRELYGWLKRHLAEHQMPVRWHRVTEIPRTSRGKINRAEVAKSCAKGEPLDLRAILQGRS